MLETRFWSSQTLWEQTHDSKKMLANLFCFPSRHAPPQRLAADLWEKWCPKERVVFHLNIYYLFKNNTNFRSLSSIDVPNHMWQ